MTNTKKLIALVPLAFLLTACGSGPGISNPFKDSGIALCEYTAANPEELDAGYMKKAAAGSEHTDIKSAGGKLASLMLKAKASELSDGQKFDAIEAYFDYAGACSHHGINQPMGSSPTT